MGHEGARPGRRGGRREVKSSQNQVSKLSQRVEIACSRGTHMAPARRCRGGRGGCRARGERPIDAAEAAVRGAARAGRLRERAAAIVAVAGRDAASMAAPWWAGSARRGGAATALGPATVRQTTQVRCGRHGREVQAAQRQRRRHQASLTATHRAAARARASIYARAADLANATAASGGQVGCDGDGRGDNARDAGRRGEVVGDRRAAHRIACERGASTG